MSQVPDFIIETGDALLGEDQAAPTDPAFHISDGRIAAIGDVGEFRHRMPDMKRAGGKQFIATPGFVNAHHHFGVTPLMQGIPFAPLELWLPRFRAMRRIPAQLDTLFSAIEMLESGTTAVQHIHSGLSGDETDWDREAHEILGAYREIGMRAGFCFMVRDQNVLTYRPDAETLSKLGKDVRNWLEPQLRHQSIPVEHQMAFARALADEFGRSDSGRFRINVAPANLHWCSDDALERLFGTAREIGGQIHMHLVETERQSHYARERFGRTAVAHLHALGLLGDNTTLGHGNWLTGDDLDILSDCKCCICHNASSGLRLGSGIAPVNAMRERGLTVALGIDQSNITDDRDMLIEMKLAWALHRETGMFNERASAADVLRMASEGGARTLGLGESIGRLAPGMAADIVLLDRAALERPAVAKHNPLAETVLHRARADAVREVYVGGERVVADGKVCRIDRDGVMAAVAERLDSPLSAAEADAMAMSMKLVNQLAELHRRHTVDRYRPYRFNAIGDD